MVPPQDSTPDRTEIATRSRMIEVWERGRKDFPSEIARDIPPDPAEEWHGYATTRPCCLMAGPR
jgi:hypothetical protein